MRNRQNQKTITHNFSILVDSFGVIFTTISGETLSRMPSSDNMTDLLPEESSPAPGTPVTSPPEQYPDNLNDPHLNDRPPTNDQQDFDFFTRLPGYIRDNVAPLLSEPSRHNTPENSTISDFSPSKTYQFNINIVNISGNRVHISRRSSG